MNALLGLLSGPVALLLVGTTPPPLESLRGRGVHYADATTVCPKVGIGTRGDHACLRIGLDDEHSSADIDRSKHRIVLRNAQAYDDEQIVGDVILPGWARSEAGRRTPVEVHLVVRKKGRTFHTKLYAHVVTREKPKQLEIEDFEVVLSDGKAETVAVTSETARKSVLDPGLSARMAGFLMEVTDNLASAPAKAGEPRPLGDITISIGLGPAAKKMLRAQFFRSGADAELRFTALSNRVPRYIVQRDLFLYGIEGVPALAEVKKRGLRSGESMVIAVRGGKGSVTFGATSSDLPDAANSMRDFLATAYVGMLLAHQAHLDPAP